MAVITGTVIAGLAVASSAKNASDARKDAKRGRQRADQLSRQTLANGALADATIATSFGQGVVTPQTATGNASPAENALMQNFFQRSGKSSRLENDINTELVDAAGNKALGSLNTPDGLDAFSFVNAANQQTLGVNRDQQQQLTDAFGGALATASQDPNAITSQQLDLLRQQARPGEDRAANSLADRLFASGRLGTTGGAQLFGELASAQENADIGRQLAATQVGQQIQNNAAGRASRFAGDQRAFVGQEQDILNDSFGRALQGTSLQNQNALSRFGVAQSVFNNTLSTRSANQSNAITDLNAIRSFEEQQFKRIQIAQNQQVARSNAGLGVGSTQASLLNTQIANPVPSVFGSVADSLNGFGAALARIPSRSTPAAPAAQFPTIRQA